MNYSAYALSWLFRLQTSMMSLYSKEVFVSALRMGTSYSNFISNEEFQAWLTTLGQKIALNPEQAESVKTLLKAKYASIKNSVPSRASIDAAFASGNENKNWTYFDASKIAAMDAFKTAKIEGSSMVDYKYLPTSETIANTSVSVPKMYWVYGGIATALAGFAYFYFNKDQAA